MSTFRLYLWKEWREQRTAVIALAGMLPMLVLAITLGLKARQVGVAYFSSAIGLVSLGVTLLAIGGELLGSDRRTGGQWLERLPAGLGGAFPAKLVLLVLTSVLALVYGFALATLGAFLRGRAMRSPLALANEVPLIALIVFGGAALLVAWTFAASAWSGRGMIALLMGGMALGGVALVVRHLLVLDYSPPALEIVTVSFALVAAGIVSAWVSFVKGRRFGRGLLETAARGIPAGALCMVPLAAWSVHQLRDRTAFDFGSPENRVQAAWISGDGGTALLYVLRESERWGSLPSRVVRADLDDGTYETVGGPGADFVGVYSEELDEPMQQPGLACVYGSDLHEATLVFDALTGELLPAARVGPVDSMLTYARAGHGFMVSADYSYVHELVDPYHGLCVSPEEIGVEHALDFHIGPALWLVETWPQWLEYSPECAELRAADWMDPTAVAGPMLADGRLLVHLPGEDRFALVDPSARTLLPLIGPGPKGWPVFLQVGGLRAGEPAFVETTLGRCLLDEEHLELVPCDDSYGGELLRWLPDGTLFFLTDDGLYRRAPSGERTCVFSLTRAEVAP